MPAKKHSLKGKEVQFLLRRGHKIYGELLVFRVWKQYPNIHWSQWSIQVPVKLDKRATLRNLLKRKAHEVFSEIYQEYLKKEAVRNTDAKHFKAFIFVNKKAIQGLKEVIATGDKRAIVNARQNQCRKDFTLFLDRLGSKLSNQ